MIVSNIDDLNKFQEGYHDAIVFDDIDFSHFPPNALIHLVDIDHTRTVTRAPSHAHRSLPGCL